MQQLKVHREDLLINPGLNRVGLEEIISRKLVFLLKAKGRPAVIHQNRGVRGGGVNASVRVFTSALSSLKIVIIPYFYFVPPALVC